MRVVVISVSSCSVHSRSRMLFNIGDLLSILPLEDVPQDRKRGGVQHGCLIVDSRRHNIFNRLLRVTITWREATMPGERPTVVTAQQLAQFGSESSSIAVSRLGGSSTLAIQTISSWTLCDMRQHEGQTSDDRHEPINLSMIVFESVTY